MPQKGGMHAVAVCVFLFGTSLQVSAGPVFSHGLPEVAPSQIVPVVVFGRNSRRGVEEFAAGEKLTRSSFAAGSRAPDLSNAARRMVPVS